MSVLKKLTMWFALPILLIAGWWAWAAVSQNFFVPTPDKVAVQFVEIWLGPAFWTDVVPSVGRLIAALLLSVVIGVALGILVGLSRNARWLLEPIFEFIRAIPSTVLLPVLLLLIGINSEMKITLIVLGCVWPIVLNTIEGVRGLDEILTNSARIYGVRGARRLTALILPGASPQIMAGIRQSLAVGLILMIVSEITTAEDGIGRQITAFQNRLAIPEMWSAIVLLGIIGVLVSIVFGLIQKRVLRWYYGLKEASNGN